jgi:RNA polymerase sigma-70 factor (ECF subfamily)
MPANLGARCAALEEGDPLPPGSDRPVSGDTSLEDIYRRERSALMRFVSARARQGEAEDIVQQVFARMAATSAGAAVVAPGPYLRQAARNTLKDQGRQAARRGAADHVPIDDVPLSDGDPVAALEARDRLMRIEEAVGRLKPLTRQIFLACRIDGYSYAEIAQATGLSVRGVEKQMSRAIKQLGRHLRRHD